jgi:hypothetical protein
VRALPYLARICLRAIYAALTLRVTIGGSVANRLRTRLSRSAYRLAVVAGIDRQAQLRGLLELEPVVAWWSIRFARGDGVRLALVRRYLMAQAELHVGLVREVRRGKVSEMDLLVVVDEFAETVRAIQRPALSATQERRFRNDLEAAPARPRFLNQKVRTASGADDRLRPRMVMLHCP